MTKDFRNAPDYYSVLGVEKTATADELKSAYRQLAKKWHPDRNPDNKVSSEEKFKSINEAYEVLSDPAQKNAFDSRHDRVNSHGYGNPWGVNPGWNDFEHFYRAQTAAIKGRNIRGTMSISFKESILGSKFKISIPKAANCTICTGSGAKKTSICGSCGGTGKKIIHFGPDFARTQSCFRCGGNGKIIVEKCPPCHGTGTTKVEVQLEVDVPAGIESGNVLVARGQGEDGPGGPGDVHIIITVSEDSRFSRVGHSLLTSIRIDLVKALTGGMVNFKWIDDSDMGIMIPNNCPNRHLVEVKDKGASKGGSLIVEVSYNIPTMSAEDTAQIASVLSKYSS